MKKILMISAISLLVLLPVQAEVNLPSGPVYDKPVSYTPSASSKTQTQSQPQSDYAGGYSGAASSSKGRLDSLAMSALRAAEKRDNAGMNEIMRKMMDAGAEGFSSPQIVQKRTPHCPPIRMELNGRNLSGSMCARMGYLYKGKQYDVGYCK